MCNVSPYIHVHCIDAACTGQYAAYASIAGPSQQGIGPTNLSQCPPNSSSCQVQLNRVSEYIQNHLKGATQVWLGTASLSLRGHSCHSCCRAEALHYMSLQLKEGYIMSYSLHSRASLYTYGMRAECTVNYVNKHYYMCAYKWISQYNYNVRVQQTLEIQEHL